MEEATDTADEDKAFKTLQHIFPDLVVNGSSLSGNGFLTGKKSIAGHMALSTFGFYHDDRTGNPNAVVNARQKLNCWMRVTLLVALASSIGGDHLL